MKKLIVAAVLSIFFLTSCNYNPLIENNRTTGSPVGLAAGAGAGIAAAHALGGGKAWMAIAGVAGGMLGYYVTTLRFDAGGIVMIGGVVYKVGDFVGIYIPTDLIFEYNTDEFTRYAGPVLDSAVAVLQRYPNNNILISGNTSGFARVKWEVRLSEARARRVSAYLWSAGINDFKGITNDLRKLNYVGYGNYFPVSSNLTNERIRQNSRIQIVSYPSDCDLHLDKRNVVLKNISAIDEGPPPEGELCPSHTYTSQGLCVPN